ncbi:hypothetical protein C2S51_019366 [Perilla frutescens var. frutescens]|nr:hypothetical protein C2S51_019366 [Perilla frutescens var. frutescens]
MMLLSKAAISSGMKPSVFVAYRQAFATVALLPLAFFFPSSKDCPPLTWTGWCKILLLSSYGLALSPNLTLAGFKYVSATIGAAAFSVVLPLVFIISISLRIEKLGLSERHGVAKLMGSIVCLSGAMTFTFYKGSPLSHDSRIDHHAHHWFDQNAPTEHQWVKGSLLTLASTLCVSLWLTHQAQLLKQYPGKLRFTILQNGFSCLIASTYAAATESHLSSWKLGWNIHLLSVAYSGIIVIGMTYWLQAWVIEKKGPIFNAIFGPLTLIIAAIFSAIFLQEIFHWGSFLGCGLVIGGLYIFLWGSNEEAQIVAQKELGLSAEEAQMEGIIVTSISLDADIGAQQKLAQPILTA